jgi:phosphoesterase RecJ-like protein
MAKGHDPIVVSPTDYGVYLHWMPGNPSVLIWEENKKGIQKYIDQAELIFCLDFNNLGRIEDMGESIRLSPAKKIMIDHHLEPEGFEDYRLWNPEACATAELVYKFIGLLGDEAIIDKNMAICLYTGIMTDSGSFQYSNVSPQVHLITAHLMSTGMDHTMIHRNIYDTMKESQLRFFGHCIKEKLVILPKFRAAYISVNKEELRQYNILTGDTEGLVNYTMSLSETVVGALIVERDKVVKLSLRSKGNFPVNEIAKKYFHGGGHINAAGGTSYENLQQTIAKFEEAVKEFEILLLNN